jgi:hypothetical protein
MLQRVGFFFHKPDIKALAVKQPHVKNEIAAPEAFPARKRTGQEHEEKSCPDVEHQEV